MKKHWPVLSLMVLGALFIGLFMTACPDPLPPPPSSSGGGDGLWAFNISTSRYYRVRAAKLFDGNKCEVWAERGSGVSEADAKKIADEYDNVIYDKVLKNFGIENFEYTYSISKTETATETFNDVMEFANWLTGSKKLLILLLDIKDGYKKSGDAYVAGYFSGINFYQNGRYSNGVVNNSNETTMIYIDTNPGLIDSRHVEQMYGTFAHEFQHLVSFATALAKGREATLDTWIDEGLSLMAEYLYKGEQTDRYEWFNEDKEGTIAKGNNFYVWGNYKGNSMLDEYATAYMFFRWLYLQSSEDSQLFKNISGSEKYDHRTVTDVAGQISGRSKWNNWETLLGDWLAANYINDKDSEYGYKKEAAPGGVFSGLVVRTPKTTAPHTLNLYPGEGVYSKIDNPFVPGDLAKPGNIRYAGLQKNPNTIDDDKNTPYTGSALLSFNANTSGSAVAEKAYLTGIALPVQPKLSSVLGNQRQVQDDNRPRVIDANDLIGRQKTLPKIELQW